MAFTARIAEDFSIHIRDTQRMESSRYLCNSIRTKIINSKEVIQAIKYKDMTTVSIYLSK